MEDIARYKKLFIKAATDHINEMNTLLDQLKNNNDIATIAQLHLHTHSLKGEFYAMSYQLYGSYITIVEAYLRPIVEAKSLIPPDKLLLIQATVKEMSNFIKLVEYDQKEPENLTEKINILKEQLGVSL
jgi:chemotaxis protein histidine kinase CheA